MSNNIILKNLYIAIKNRNLENVNMYLNELKSSSNNLVFEDYGDDDAYNKTPLQYACYFYDLKEIINEKEYSIVQTLLFTKDIKNSKENNLYELFMYRWKNQQKTNLGSEEERKFTKKQQDQIIDAITNKNLLKLGKLIENISYTKVKFQHSNNKDIDGKTPFEYALNFYLNKDDLSQMAWSCLMNLSTDEQRKESDDWKSYTNIRMAEARFRENDIREIKSEDKNSISSGHLFGTIAGFGNGIRNNIIPGLWSSIENNMLTKPICDAFYKSTTALVKLLPVSNISKNFGITLSGSLAPIATGFCTFSILKSLYSDYNKKISKIEKIYNASCRAVAIFGQLALGAVGATIGTAMIGAPIIGSIVVVAAAHKAGSWAYKTIARDESADRSKSL